MRYRLVAGLSRPTGAVQKLRKVAIARADTSGRTKLRAVLPPSLVPAFVVPLGFLHLPQLPRHALVVAHVVAAYALACELP